MSRKLIAALVAVASLTSASLVSTTAKSEELPAPPAAGANPRIDAIRKSGVLRVAVLANIPWLVENTTGSGAQWSGPAWVLANDYATLLGVKLEPVAVSHETKIPVLAANQVDMSITPLGETPERDKVVDFVLYSSTSICMFGRGDNANFAGAKSIDDLNDPKVTIAYFIGGAEEGWVKERFPKAQLRGVTSSSAVAPIEEIMAHRADAAPINRIPWVGLNKKVKGLKALPAENNCQDSKEKASPVGLAVDKGQPAYLEWLAAVAKAEQPKLQAEESRIIETQP
jgi:polar amino acid transport system substrate-binding protein